MLHISNRSEANYVRHGWLSLVFHTLVWRLPIVQAETNLILAQKYYRSRFEELKGLIMVEESKFKLELSSLKNYFSLIRNFAGQYSKK